MRPAHANLSAFESLIKKGWRKPPQIRRPCGRSDRHVQGALKICSPATSTHDRCDTSRNAWTASNNFRRFLSIMIVCVPSSSST
jgi:hypothetical protein